MNLPLNRVCRFFLAIFALTAGACILYRFPPDRYTFYPQCPIHTYLHLECPGCGTTRAFAALLHGHLSAALHFNALAILVALPLTAAYAGVCFKGSLQRNEHKPFRWPTIPRSATIALIALTAAFTLLRNL